MLIDYLFSAYDLIETNKKLSVAVVSSFVLLYFLIAYPLFISPLRDLPGPYYLRVSSIPSLHYQRKGRWIGLVHDLHEKYGDVVVIGPNEVSLSGDPKYINDVYVKNFPKTTFYENFRNHGHRDNMFASLENDRHLNYKKNISNIYSKSAVFNLKNTTRNFINRKIKELIQEINDTSVEGTRPDFINCEGKVNIHGKGHHEKDPKWAFKGKTGKNMAIDVYSLFGSLAIDVVTAFELGIDNATNFLKEPENRFIVIYHRYIASMQFWTTLMPRFWNLAATKLIFKSLEFCEDWRLKLYARAEDNVPQFKEGQNFTTLELLKKNGINGLNAYSFLTDNIFAGHETTAIQLTYLTYELSRPKNQYLQDLLRNELLQNYGAPTSINDTIEDFESIDNLPILNAIILETSRVHTSIPGAEPREVDREYFVKVKDQKVKLPLKTIVSCQPYSMHRKEEIFPKADYFVVERWLRYDGETQSQYEARTKMMQKYMMPFGKGIRMCLGMNIAQIEMKAAVANLYWHFNSKICDNWANVVQYPNEQKLPEPIRIGEHHAGGATDEQMMTMCDCYTTRPYYDECWLEWYHNEELK